MSKFIIKNKYFIFDQPIRNNLKTKIKNIRNKLYSFYYKGKMKLHHKKRKTQSKYNVSICAIFKNEARYFKEWIEFHKIIGIDHFYLYNNNSDDNFMDILKPYIDKGIITLIDWPKNQAQMEAYEDCIKNFREETNWLGFIDIDEFIIPNEDNTISDFLSKFENRPSVLIYWKMFGSSGKMKRKDGLVIEDFVVCWENYCDMGKCFYNTKYEYAFGNDRNKCLHHLLWTKGGQTIMPPVNIFDIISFPGYNKAKSLNFPIQINHYFTKTYEEYEQKKSKGDVYFKLNPHDEEYFFKHEMKSVCTDYSAYKYLIKLKKELKINE